MKNKWILFALIILTFGCTSKNDLSDAYGNFEATEVTISSEANGKILFFSVEEGQTLPKDTAIGLIDTVDLSLKKQALIAQRKAIAAKLENVSSQIEVQLQQKDNLLIEKRRIENLLKDNAATGKQLDDINASIRLVDKQITSINTQNSGITEEMDALTKQIAQINESIKKCVIKNPVAGTVLEKYVESNEIATMGKALYKIADLNNMYLKVYVSELQLSSVKIGQKVDILIDKSKKENSKLKGEVSWISDKAEFTPKIIQTKEERVNLVYAVKIRVKNDGSLKISMPGEVNFIKK